MTSAAPEERRPGTPPALNPVSDRDNGADASEGTSEVVVAPARAWKLFQVRVSPDVWAWTHRAAVLMRLTSGRSSRGRFTRLPEESHRDDLRKTCLG